MSRSVNSIDDSEEHIEEGSGLPAKKLDIYSAFKLYMQKMK
jgi:hypothetical protein